jgi:hypothetical protein
LRGASSDTNSVTIKAALGVVRIGETSEFLAVFPQHRALFAFVQARFEAIRAALLRELKQQHAAEDGDDDDDDDDEDEGDDDDDDGDETTSSALAWQPRIGPVRKLASQFSGDVNTANVAQFLMNCDTELLQKAIGRQTEMAAAKSWATPRRKQHGQQRRGKGGRRK